METKNHYLFKKSPPNPCVTFRKSWRTTHFWLFRTAYSIYSQLPSLSAGRLLHPRPEDVPCRGDRDPLYMVLLIPHGGELHAPPALLTVPIVQEAGGSQSLSGHSGDDENSPCPSPGRPSSTQSLS